MTLFITEVSPDIARINELTDLLNQANDKYRRGERSGLTDTEFDKLLRELKTLENKYPDAIRADSPTQRIGHEPLNGIVRVQHRTPMLSIENVYTPDTLAEFLQKTIAEFAKRGLAAPHWMIEHKVDGVALALLYKDGVLTAALTRGDGQEGENVLANARTIDGIPLTLNLPGRRIEIRGEVYMKNSEFRSWNGTGRRLYANPRNAVAGAIRLQDPQECARRPLCFMAHTVADHDALPRGVTTQNEFLNVMVKAGFAVPRVSERRYGSHEVVPFCLAAYAEGSELVKGIDYETDGLVIKLDDLAQRAILGTTSSTPRWAVAYKVEKYEATTVLNDVTWQMGKTGICSPVAELAPVAIAGTTVSRATLFNLDIIAELGLAIGDTVKVEKAGKIIPHIVSVESKGAKRRKIEPPKHCPSCRWELVTENGRNGGTAEGNKKERSTVVRCENPSCPAQLADKITFYASRDGVDIPGIGEQLACAMVEGRLVADIADLYALTEQQLTKLPRMGQGVASKLVQAIKARKTPLLEKFLHGLTIPNVGAGTSSRLAKHCRSLQTVAAASESELAAIVDIGPTTARSIYQYFHSTYWNTMSKKFQENDVRPADVSTTTSTSLALAGLTIVVTGTLQNYDRRTIEATIEEHGGKVSSSVSSKTSYVLVGDKPGSKLTKAQNLGVSTINESQFNTMIGV